MFSGPININSCRGWLVIFPVVFITLILAGCAARDISMRGSLVKLVTAEQAHILEYECRQLGNVVGNTYWYQFMTDAAAHDSALNELLDNAAELGATHVFVNRGNYSSLRGEAYLCSYCRLPDGTADISRCLNDKGREVIGLDRISCEKKRYHWYMRSLDRETCIDRGGDWIPDRDILRLLPVQMPTNNRKQ